MSASFGIRKQQTTMLRRLSKEVFFVGLTFASALSAFAPTPQHASQPQISATHLSSSTAAVDEAFLPYQGEQPKEALNEIFVQKALPDDAVSYTHLTLPTKA